MRVPGRKPLLVVALAGVCCRSVGGWTQAARVPSERPGGGASTLAFRRRAAVRLPVLLQPPSAATQQPRMPPKTQSLPLPSLANQQLPMVEVCANGQVIRYKSTLTSIRSINGPNKLSSRDVRLLRSSAPVLAPRQGYILFDLGELRGILQHDRLILIGADLPAVGALGAEIQRRLEQQGRMDLDQPDEAPFEVRAMECMLEQVYSVFEETLQTLSVLVQNTLRDLTNPAKVDSEGRREAALSRLLPLRISLSGLQARSRRVSALLDEILDSEDDVSDMCLTFLHSLEPTNPQLTPASTAEDEPTAHAAAEGEAETTESGAAEEDEAEVTAAEAEVERAEAAQELVETLLDVYDARLNSLCDQIEQLASTIENTQARTPTAHTRSEPSRARRSERPRPTAAPQALCLPWALCDRSGRARAHSGQRAQPHRAPRAAAVDGRPERGHMLGGLGLLRHELALGRRVDRWSLRLRYRHLHTPHRLALHHVLAPVPLDLAQAARPAHGRRRSQECARAARPRGSAAAQPAAAPHRREGDARRGARPALALSDSHERPRAGRAVQLAAPAAGGAVGRARHPRRHVRTLRMPRDPAWTESAK